MLLTSPLVPPGPQMACSLQLFAHFAFCLFWFCLFLFVLPQPAVLRTSIWDAKIKPELAEVQGKHPSLCIIILVPQMFSISFKPWTSISPISYKDFFFFEWTALILHFNWRSYSFFLVLWMLFFISFSHDCYTVLVLLITLFCLCNKIVPIQLSLSSWTFNLRDTLGLGLKFPCKKEPFLSEWWQSVKKSVSWKGDTTHNWEKNKSCTGCHNFTKQKGH